MVLNNPAGEGSDPWLCVNDLDVVDGVRRRGYRWLTLQQALTTARKIGHPQRTLEPTRRKIQRFLWKAILDSHLRIATLISPEKFTMRVKTRLRQPLRTLCAPNPWIFPKLKNGGRIRSVGFEQWRCSMRRKRFCL